MSKDKASSHYKTKEKKHMEGYKFILTEKPPMCLVYVADVLTQPNLILSSQPTK